MKNFTLFYSLLFIICLKAEGQFDSMPGKWRFEGYVEIYYTYDFNKPTNHERPSFIYSFNRHHEVNINLASVKASYADDHFRANLAWGAGTYMQANMVQEPGLLKNVLEANAGIRLSSQKNLWLDAGIFPSHIGFESAAGKDCWNLTRSILADNSPYFESGIKCTYQTPNRKWLISALLLNGWQRIQRPEGNNTVCFGHQLTYTQGDKLIINSSSFIGNDRPDSIRQLRVFHNAYAIMQLNNNLSCTIGFDIGAEQKQKGSRRYFSWYSPVVLIRQKLNKNDYLSVRAEYYNDKHAVIIQTEQVNGFQTWGFSANFDHWFRKNLLLRAEARCFTSYDPVFLKEQRLVSQNYFLATSLSFSF